MSDQNTAADPFAGGTPLPWRHERRGAHNPSEPDFGYAIRFGDPARPLDPQTLTWVQLEADAARIVASANALPHLVAELEATADWADERATVLVKLLADPSGWKPADRELREVLRHEAVRLRGRAELLRLIARKATDPHARW